MSSVGEAPVSVSHIVHTLGRYLPVMALAMAAVLTGYAIVAVAVYALAASEEVTRLRFRLDFKGAEEGEYPNGTKFSSVEIVNAPVLLAVYQANKLDRYVTFPDFTKSIFVLEANDAHEALVRDYQSRLSDPKLTPIDRDRLQREFELKADSLSKDQYSLNYLESRTGSGIPDVVVRKVLHDVLNEWTRVVSNEQHVLEYRVALVSPDAVTISITEQDPVAATQVIRASVTRIQGNIESLRRIPAAELVRSNAGLSLLDIEIRLADILRFRLDPLVHRIVSTGMLTDRQSTISFLESQLAYDQQNMEAQQRRADAVRQTLMLYLSAKGSPSVLDDGQKSTAGMSPAAEGAREAETVVPQLSETFLERLVQLASNQTDATYRQRLSSEYQTAALRLIPLQQAVAHDRAMLELVRKASSGGTSMDRTEVERQLQDTSNEIKGLVKHIHEIYGTLSRNLNPATHLVTVLEAPTSRRERSISVKQLALYGLLVSFVALPIIVALCLLHNRVKEEEAAEGYQEKAAEAVS